jgi:hypothetical protein
MMCVCRIHFDADRLHRYNQSPFATNSRSPKPQLTFTGMECVTGSVSSLVHPHHTNGIIQEGSQTNTYTCSSSSSRSTSSRSSNSQVKYLSVSRQVHSLFLLVSLRSSNSCIRLLPRRLVPRIFPSIMCFIRQFLRNVCPIQLAFLRLTV